MADVDPSVWREKDLRITRQSMIKAAVEFCTQSSSFVTSAEVDDVIAIADKFVQYVYSEESKKEVVSDISHPTPTVEQKKALDKVEAETGYNVAQVYAKFGRYPNMNNWESCVKKIKEEKSNE